MEEVEIVWRPSGGKSASGGRGEIEYTPSGSLLNKRIVILPLSVPNARIATDVTGRLMDGKSRTRRDDKDDRSLLNIHPLICALALLPDPRRYDKGDLHLPLRDKKFVVSSVAFNVELEGADLAICTPTQMQILHDSSVIDLKGRLERVGNLLARSDLPPIALDLANRYRTLVAAGSPVRELRTVSKKLGAWLSTSSLGDDLDAPSDHPLPTLTPASQQAVIYDQMSADETKRRLQLHWKLDRNRGLRDLRVKEFKDKHGSVHCENCGFSFEKAYGEIGTDYIEVHHRQQLAALLPSTMTMISDLMLLCANCHRMVHRKREPLTPDALKIATKLNFPP